MKQVDVIGIGSAFVDYFFDTDDSFLSSIGLTPEHSRAIGKNEFDELFGNRKVLAKTAGGSTTITLSTLSKLGKKTGFAGVLGKDEEGEFWQKQLHKIDLQLNHLGDTAQSACLLTEQRKKRSFLYTLNDKENDFFETINYEYLNDCQFLHVTQFYSDYKKNFEQLLNLFKKIEIPKISFSPGALYAELGLDALAPLLKKTHVLFFSKYEMEVLFPDIKKGSTELLNLGPKIVVCTLAENGALITTKEKQFFSPAEKVKNIIDTTGAGDAFAGGFIAGLLEKKSVEECAQLGNHMGAKSLSNFGLSWLQ